MGNLRWKIAQKAELKWWQRYLSKKPKADYLSWKAAYWKTFLQQIGLAMKPEECILDAGCGPAGIFMILNNQKVVALDPLLDSYEKKLEHFDKSDYKNVEFVNQSLEDYDPGKTFDKVFCLNAINHVADLDLCIDKLLQLIKPGGHLILSVDAHNFKALKPIFRMIPGDILHPHQYDLQEYQDMLTDRGITISTTVLYKKEFLFNYYILIGTK